MLNQLINLTGKRFNRLTVIRKCPAPNGVEQSRKTYWECLCDCGNVKVVRADGLVNGNVASCGCLHKEQAIINVSKHHRHKMAGTKLYQAWTGMKQRCYNPNNDRYERYGGGGITVCPEWIPRFESFRDWALANGYADNLTIDRIDNDGNYEPSNCRWVDESTQGNNRRSTHLIELNGKVQSIKQWAEELNIDRHSIHRRIRRGITEPALLLSKERVKTK